MSEEIIIPHGNYQELESYQNCVVIYDATQIFCHRFLKSGDRTSDQMIQAARSGKQNIVEGCMASGVSTETEIRLVGVARASLEELLEDYRDYLRTHRQALWDKDDHRTLHLRMLAKDQHKTYKTYESYLSGNDTELVCNLLISLIHQTNYLLDRQLKALQKQFLKHGGIRERMYHARQKNREQDFTTELELLRKIYRQTSLLPCEDKSAILSDLTELANHLKKRNFYG